MTGPTTEKLRDELQRLGYGLARHCHYDRVDYDSSNYLRMGYPFCCFFPGTYAHIEAVFAPWLSGVLHWDLQRDYLDERQAYVYHPSTTTYEHGHER